MTALFTKIVVPTGFQKKWNANYNPIAFRILQPIFLGSISNIVINFLFHPGSARFPAGEFIIASFLAVPITEMNRYIDMLLDKKIDWIHFPVKRFSSHLLLISFCLLITLNVLGNAYLLITHQGFFSLKEIGVINLVTLCLAIFLTFLNWAVHFYIRWAGAETIVTESVRLVKDLQQKVIQTDNAIELQKGTSKVKVEIKDIRIAKIELGIVRIYSDMGMVGFFPGTLCQLNTLLPTNLFFQVTRDAIIHRDAIKSITSASFGKIEVLIREKKSDSSVYTVSRLKAAAFRKWYNSISA